MQYYPNTTIGTANNQHSAARMMAVLNNLQVQGLPIALTEFGVKSGGESISPQVLDDSMRLVFGSPNATGFMMWGFWAGEGLFAPGSAMYDANWNLTDTGKKWQDLLGIQDWDGNPSNAWTTNENVTVDANGTIRIAGGFFGDYHLSGQGPNNLGAKLLPFDLTLRKGTTTYSTALAKPPAWFFWKTNGSGTWSTGGNWTDAPQSGTVPSGAGKTAFFGSSATMYDTGNGTTAGAATTVNITNNATVTLPSAVTLGMLVFDNPTARYTIAGSQISLQGYNNASGNVAGIFVNRGSHTINAPLALADDTTVTVAPAGGTLTVTNLQPTSAALTKAGAGRLDVNRLSAGNVAVTGGTLRVLPTSSGGAVGVGRIGTLSVSSGAKLDLADHQLVTSSSAGSWNGSAYTGVAGLIAAGRNGGDWAGSGIITSVAGANDYTTLGLATAADVLGIADTATGTWAGKTVTGTDTLVRYTYGGDANLDGMINIDDYSNIDSSVAVDGAIKGYFNGDFNFDGSVNIDDYSFIDGNIGTQGPAL
jgi:hypothetical protein